MKSSVLNHFAPVIKPKKTGARLMQHAHLIFIPIIQFLGARWDATGH